MRLGAAWYPEHWPEERWPADLDLMKRAGINVVRVGEFAWSSLEPAEGRFELEWLERAIRLAAAQGIDVIVGTPTAAPPAWLVQRHPDIPPVSESGQRVQFGNRCHYCVNSFDFREHARTIVDRMAKHYGRLPGIIGWQIDNEFNRVCYCERCHHLFQDWLARRFANLDELNAAWSTAYWSQTYSSWRQIPLPIGYHNPGLMLEFRRFVTESYRDFQAMQIEALRTHIPSSQQITHNFMGWFGAFDHYPLSADLDVASWDNYVGTGHLDFLTNGAAHDLTRGFKRKNFWLIETQPGNVNWSGVNNPLDRGEVRAMAWHAVAHGADMVSYWQWRSALGGQEQYHGTLVAPDGTPRPLYEEVAQLGGEFARVGAALEATTVAAEAAMLYSYADRWSVEWQPHHKDFDYVRHLLHYYRPLARTSQGVDILSADLDALDLVGYKLVVAPCLMVLDERRAAALRGYVEGGGHLVLTVRTGMKDRFNRLLPARQPGPLAALLGATVAEYYALLEPAPVAFEWNGGTCGSSQMWAEWLEVDPRSEAVTLARFGASNGWLDGKAAVVMRQVGAGRVYYVGAYLDEPTQAWFMGRVCGEAGVRPVLEVPDGVEVSLRRRASAGRRMSGPAGRARLEGDDVLILVNHSRDSKEVRLPFPALELLTGCAPRGRVELGGRQVAVVTVTSSAQVAEVDVR